jgi:xanthine dehydrogenase YagR molybdenum-binding subunit
VSEATAGVLVGRGGRHPNPEDVSVRSFGVQFAEVEVDTVTGEISVVRTVTAQDSGRVVNPKLMESQVIGGIIQGIGYALQEEQVHDRALGLPLNANLEEYLVPTMADIPQIECVLIDSPDGRANSIAAKGIGEPPIIGTAPAIANAVYDAVGVRFRDLPLDRRRVLEALRKGTGR